MNKDDQNSTTVIIALIGGLLIVGFIIFIAFAYKSQSSGVANQNNTYSGDPILAPKIELSSSYFNAGELKNKSDIITTEFAITNSGKSDLIVYSLTTSCHCTTAQLVYKGATSEKFGMNKSAGWQTAIKPNENATVKIEYDPKKMLEPGTVKRGIFIATNDPTNPELTFRFEAENNLP